MKNQLRTICALTAVAFVFLVTQRTAFAVDGEVAITQERAMAGGVTPGDAPGFPVTISEPGSYVLAGNLTVPNGDTTAIRITSEHVTIDLKGFAILGPVNCSGGYPCVGAGTGDGIRSGGAFNNITIRNGAIHGMRYGVRLNGDGHVVEDMRFRSNKESGIWIFELEGPSVVRNNTLVRNGNYGIRAGNALVQGNVVGFSNVGISLFLGSVVHNVVDGNSQAIDASTSVGIIGNTMSRNTRSVLGGVDRGQNTCDGGPCSF